MSDAGAKQQIVDKIKSSTNILVTVSNNPSVDELSAALGLSLLLNKMKKHATAVFSGEIPPAISFMEPAKTFENTVDSLRDFIIALDKEKADHLRYKVEGDVVKIFITPYRTTITNEDLDFSQGDYNVELVLALGVRHQDSLDKALEAHGQIFDDATVATIVAGKDKSDLGSIGWQDQSASSLSEMMVGLSEALKADKTFIDEQIATAFLSGIVAATERFSNNRTSARVMTMAAQLMGAGANQQLIASKFEEAVDEGDTGEVEVPAEAEPEAPVAEEENIPAEELDTPSNNDGTTDLSEGESTKVERDEDASGALEEPSEEPVEASVGTLNVSHEKEGTLDEVAKQKAIEDQAAAAEVAEAAASAAQPVADVAQEVSDTLPPVVEPVIADVSPEDLRRDVEAATAAVEEAAEAPQLQGAVSSEQWQKADEPTFGGALNATTEAAADDARQLEEADRNKPILNHEGEYIADRVPTYNAPLNAASQPSEEPSIVNPLNEPAGVTMQAAPIQPPIPDPVSTAEQTQEAYPDGLPPLPDFSTLPPLPPLPPISGEPSAADEATEKLGDILPPAEASQLAPASDPGQFKIPGQS